MHAADLGTFADAAGSLFWLEVNNRAWYASTGQGMAALNQDLNAYYHSQHAQGRNLSQVTPLVYTQIMGRTPGYPFLKAKAAQTRHLSEFCLAIANRHSVGDARHVPFSFRATHHLAGQERRHLDLLVRLFEGFHEFTVTSSARPFVVANCRQAMYKYLQSLAGLNRLWRVGVAEQSRLPFRLRPKAHMCQHLVEESIVAFGSPSAFWCYRDEDFVGAIKKIAAKSKHPATLERRCIEKLRILAALES